MQMVRRCLSVGQLNSIVTSKIQFVKSNKDILIIGARLKYALLLFFALFTILLLLFKYPEFPLAIVTGFIKGKLSVHRLYGEAVLLCLVTEKSGGIIPLLVLLGDSFVPVTLFNEEIDVYTADFIFVVIFPRVEDFVLVVGKNIV